MKKMIALIAVTLLSACGTEESSAALREEALGTAESALAVCRLNSCPTGYALVGYSCNDACNTSSTKCGDARWNNESQCTAYSSLVGQSYVGCGGSCPRAPNTYVETHYVNAYTHTSACVADPRYPYTNNNASQCSPLPSSGTVHACGSCPPGWATTSLGSPDSQCTTSGGAVQNRVTCTK